ncbi:methionine--tRNA ligase [Candidatus Woesearchaeota archaeon]|nr:MAG: methionine--tRNA ligase [Candidatus Woesearchaeota archaeon]
MACDPKKVTKKDFEKLELRIGKITGAELHENKIDYILLIDLGPAERDIQIVADLKESYKIEDLIGKQCVVLLNICCEEVGGIESEAMLLTATKDNKPVLLQPENEVPTGERVVGIMDSEAYHFDDVGE